MDNPQGKTITHHTNHGVIVYDEKRKLSRKQRSYLDLAAKLAVNSEVSTHHHGAVIVNGGRVLAMSVNKWRNQSMVALPSFSNTGEKNKDITVHAEVRAMSHVSEDKLKGATVYVAKVSASDDVTEKLSRPCDNCFQALVDAGVKRIVYTI